MDVNEHGVIPFRCPHCGHTVRAAVPMAGRAMGCPTCDDRLTVPAPLPPPDRTAALAPGFPLLRRSTTDDE